MGGKSTPTLDDVARLAGVSTATVSRCLNFPKQVAEKTQTKVQAAIAELGYSPNFGAKAMASRRTHTIGAIIPTMENAVFARGLQAFQEELRSYGYTLLVASSSYRADLEQEQIRTLVARGADGLLLIGHERDAGIYEFLATQNIPVLIAWAVGDGSVPFVGFDNAKAMNELARAVVAQGHRRIGLISGDLTGNDRAKGRLAGITQALRANHLPSDSLTVIERPYGIENGASAFATLMQSPNPPTAVMCGNDVLAVGALRKARELGLDVPKDVSITGFDDIELAQAAVPELATVRVPHLEMGKRAANMLIAQLQGATEIVSHTLEAQIQLRASLGPVKPTE